MGTIERKEFYRRLCEQSELLAALYLDNKPAEATRETEDPDCQNTEPDPFVTELGFVHTPLPGDPLSFEDHVYERRRDLEDLILNGAKQDDDPGLRGLDGLCRSAELHERAIDAKGGHPFDILVSTLAHIDPAERTRWYVVIHPAVWMDVRLDADELWFRAAVDETGLWKKVGGAHLIITSLMEDRSILMFREDATNLRLSDVELSTTKTEPPGNRARLLLRLELDPDHVQLVHNLG